MALQTHKRETPLSEINIIPLVDVILVLLIIFMIAAPMLEQSIAISLPQGTADNAGEDRSLFFLTINSDGKIFLPGDKKAVTLAEAESQIAGIYGTREDKAIYLRADKDISYGLVVELMSACKRAGVEKIGLVTVPETTETHTQ